MRAKQRAHGKKQYSFLCQDLFFGSFQSDAACVDLFCNKELVQIRAVAVDFNALYPWEAQMVPASLFLGGVQA